MAVERVLIVGATGNIGVAATIAALRTKREVLAIVRNQNSADKYFKHVGTRESITTTEADVMSESGVQSVVDQVKAGTLPAFQHVYTCVGAWRDNPMHEVTDQAFRDQMRVGFEANFFAYRATLPHLLTLSPAPTTFTLIVGASATNGYGGLVALTQGALSSFMNAAILQNRGTNVRINEAYLNGWVAYDSEAQGEGVFKSSEYAKIYQGILEDEGMNGCRVIAAGREDLEKLRVVRKLED